MNVYEQIIDTAIDKRIAREVAYEQWRAARYEADFGSLAPERRKSIKWGEFMDLLQRAEELSNNEMAAIVSAQTGHDVSAGSINNALRHLGIKRSPQATSRMRGARS